MDIEQDPEVAEAAGVTGTPTVQLFKQVCASTAWAGRVVGGLFQLLFKSSGPAPVSLAGTLHSPPLLHPLTCPEALLCRRRW